MGGSRASRLPICGAAPPGQCTSAWGDRASDRGRRCHRYPRSEPPYYFLPMFQHSAVPVVDWDLFRPVVRKIRFPSILTNLLLPPQNSPERNHFSPVRNPRGVEVWCNNQISVRINRGQLRFRCLASMLFLGTPLFFYFHYDLNDCGSTQTTMNGQLVYSSSLHLSPEPQGPMIRAIPLNLPIQCICNREMGTIVVRRELHAWGANVLQSLRSFYPQRWVCLLIPALLQHPRTHIPHPAMKSFATLGNQTLTFSHTDVAIAFISILVVGISACMCFRCMVDSSRKGSQSLFFSRESNVLRFTVDAFLSPRITATVRLYDVMVNKCFHNGSE
ncbi:uncharacterized protein LOC127914318 isoform X1 [Oncorhynchus keta]|uniref:uncharacterized protein LOC127914318 isoform X1 n=1 Tax=Oncorhynchus keta TaxID=8018 RepID=UPI00227B5445|nr:uncharacterized protein LOC127914318 isoform X1 [Oncorhynchus keta]